MMTYQEYVAIADHIRAAVGEAEIGVILGSGLGDYVEALEDAKYIDYKDIPGFVMTRWYWEVLLQLNGESL